MIPGIVAGRAVPVGPVLWTPAHTTTQLWYDFGDASTVTTASGAVSAISDKSGNGFGLTQGSGGARPAYNATGLNGLGIATFDGSNDQLRKDSASSGLIQNAGAAAAFALRRFSSVPSANQFVLCIRNGTTGGARLNVEAGRDANKPSVGGRRLDANSHENIFGAADVTTDWQLQSGDWLWSSASLYQYINGEIDGSSMSFQTAGNTSNTAPVGIVLGSGPTGTTEFLSGSVAEIIVVPTVDTDLRQRIEGYMMWRRGLQALLPISHPYRDEPPYV